MIRNRHILLIVLAISLGNVIPESALSGGGYTEGPEGWEVATIRDDNAYFIDPESIVKTGDSAYQYWVISNHKKPKRGIRSKFLLEEVRCEKRQMRFLKFGEYPGWNREGGGELRDVPYDRRSWIDVPPNSGGEYILKKVCKMASPWWKFWER